MRDLLADNTTTDLVLLEYVHIIVAHSSEECGAAEGCWAGTDDGDGFLIRRWKILGKRRVSDLGDAHLFEDSNGKLLEPVNFDCTLLGLAHVAVSCAELADGAELAASQTERVVRQDDLRGTIPVLVLDVIDETLDINSRRAALLARSVVTLEAALGLTDSLLNGHQRDVTLPVVNLGGTVAVRCPVELLRVLFSCLGSPQGWLCDLIGHRSHDVLLNIIGEFRETFLGPAASASTSAA